MSDEELAEAKREIDGNAAASRFPDLLPHLDPADLYSVSPSVAESSNSSSSLSRSSSVEKSFDWPPLRSSAMPSGRRSPSYSRRAFPSRPWFGVSLLRFGSAILQSLPRFYWQQAMCRVAPSI